MSSENRNVFDIPKRAPQASKRRTLPTSTIFFVEFDTE
jgi:hypothetical protein